jgi:hypothetical protein
MIVARVAVGAALVLVAAICVLAIVFWPWLLVFPVAGLVVGYVARRLLRRRSATTTEPHRASTTSGPLQLAIGGAVVVALLFATFSVQGINFDTAPPAVRVPQEHALRAHYDADLTYQERGDWAGTERFELSEADARRVVAEAPGSLEQRLANAVPADWEVAPDESGGKTVYGIQRDFPSHPFAVPGRRPLTVTSKLPAPELRSDDLLLPVFAAGKSTVTLHAPESRIHATTPPSSPKPETGAGVVWAVPLKVLGEERAGSGVKVDVESDFATYLPEEFVGRTVPALVAALLGSLGLTIGGVPALAGSGLRWLWGRRPSPAPAVTPSVLRGATNKLAALVAHLKARGLDDAQVQDKVDAIEHEARKLARDALNVAGDDEMLKRYNAVLKRLDTEKVPALDAIYRALAEVGIANSELRVIDMKLDELIAARSA